MNGIYLIRRWLVVSFAAVLLLAPVIVKAESPPTEIEVYYGTRKFAPIPKPPADPKAGAKAVASVMAKVQNATCSALQSTSSLMTRLIERSIPKWEPPHVPIVVNVTLPPQPAQPPIVVSGGIQTAGFSGSTSASTPALLPWVNGKNYPELMAERAEPREEPKPTVIVVRDSSRPAEANGLTLSTEAVLFAVALFGIALCVTVLATFRRASRASDSHPFGSRFVSASIREGHVAIGGCDAGPMPSTAERFDMGPTMAEQLEQRKAAEKASENAMLQNILEHNLAMRADLAK